MSGRLLLIALALAVSASAQVDPADLIAKVAAKFKSQDGAFRNYTFVESHDATTSDKRGKIASHTTFKYEIVFADGASQRRMIERNGIQLPGAMPSIPTPVQGWTKQPSPVPRLLQMNATFEGRYRKLTSHLPLPFEDLPRLFDIRLAATEEVGGRNVYRLEATPRVDAMPADQWERAELCQHVKLWLDAEDLFPVRLRYDLISDCGHVLKGSSIETFGQKINGEAWLFTSTLTEAKFQDGNTVLGIKVQELRSDFKKFGAETRLLEPTALPALSGPRRAESVAAAPEFTDAAEIRAMVQRGMDAFFRKDTHQLFSLFSGRSPTLLILRMKIQSAWARLEDAALASIQIRQITVTGETAGVHLSYLSPSGDGRERNFFTFELVREAGAWKLWNAFDEQEAFAAELLAAASDEERDQLLAAQTPLVTEELVDHLFDRGSELLERGEYREAQVSFQLAYRLAEKFRTPKTRCEALFGLGRGNLAQGSEDVAEDYFRRSLEVCHSLGDESILAFGFSLLGHNYADRGDFRRAMTFFQRSVEISARTRDNGHLAGTLESIGDLFAKQGNDAQALIYYQRSQRLLAQLDPADNQEQLARSVGKIGRVFTRQGTYEQALDYSQKALKPFQELGYRSEAAGAFQDIGDNYFLQTRLNQASDNYQKSLDLYEELNHKPGMALALSRLANVALKLGDSARAIEFGVRAAEMAKGLDNMPDLSWILTNLGSAYLAARKYDQAFEALQDAIAQIEKLRTQIAGNEQDEERFFERRVDPYHEMIELLVEQKRFPEALAYAERAKGRVLLDVLRNGREDITKAMTSDELAQERRLEAVIRALDARLRQENAQSQPDAGLAAGLGSQLKAARLQYEAFQTILYSVHGDLKAQRGETAAPAPADLEALPDQQTALLHYVVTPQRTYIFVLAHNIPVKVYIVPIHSEILASRVAGFRKMLADNALGFREPGRQLYDLLLAPAGRDLAGMRRIGLVPDGPLWELPFQALISGSNRYVLEDRAVFYVPSLSVLREMTSMKPTANRVLLAVGDPVAATVPDNALAETGRMVHAIEQIYGSTNSRVLTGEAARGQTVKAESGNYQILHFATHGILENDDPLYSRLLFAGSNGKADGYLEAREMMRLDLHADLAVLSACETARGRVSEGEGLLGMSWALFVAGVPTTVVSQWKVDSASTSALMIGFHRLLKARLSPPEETPANKAEVLRHPVAAYHLLRSRGILEASKAEILRVAALQLMAKPEYRHPFYWAGFVVMGDGL